MEMLWVWMLVLGARLAAPRVQAWLRARRERPAPLCWSCAWSHIERGARPRQVRVFCGLGQRLRPLRFAVRECTDFRDWRQPVRARAGFVPAGDLAPSGRAVAQR